MSSVLRSVRKRKKGHTLGAVDVIGTGWSSASGRRS